MKEIDIKDILIKDLFWNRYVMLMKEQVIPYQWEILNDLIEGAEPSYTVKNFKIAAGIEKGEFNGFVFQDSDLYKWIEAVGNVLQIEQNDDLENKANDIIEYIALAQQEDGYLNTYYQLKEPEKKWSNILECHELYCAGHFMEAAVSYYKGTKKKKILDMACKLADCINNIFGPEEGKLHGYPGHQEIEIGLQKLYSVTENDKFLKLAAYFINVRGTNNFFEEEFEKRNRISHWTKAVESEPNRFYNQFPSSEYNQYHLPVIEQNRATGHAVRAVYLYTAMADLAEKTQDKKLFDVCKRLWDNITNKQMYITGSIGSTPAGEAFTLDYDLPNDTNYSETCASIGLIFFSYSMLKIDMNSIYADVIERALYNTVLAGVALDGKKFFYVNPLEMVPSICEANPERHHVKPGRQTWYACACCPPNIARTLTSIGKYIYSTDINTIYVHLYIGNESVISLDSGKVYLKLCTEYPYNEDVHIEVNTIIAVKFTIALRVPGWCNQYSVLLNNENIEYKIEQGYLYITRVWKQNDSLDLVFRMPIRLIQSNEKLYYNHGKVAILRGPLVYCLEECDNGKSLNSIILSGTVKPYETYEPILNGIIMIHLEAVKMINGRNCILYSDYSEEKERIDAKAIPYFLWNNREQGEMLTWIRVV